MLAKVILIITSVSTRATVLCLSLLLLALPSSVFAQVLTNGTSSAITINRGDVVTINTGGPTVNTWVGLYAIGANNQAYQEWFYLSGTKYYPPAPVAAAQFGFRVSVPAANYEFRLFRDGYVLLATSAALTVNPLTISVNGVSAPTSTTAEPSGSIQVGVASAPGTSTHSWFGLYLAGAANGAYLDWFFLNGTKTAPSTALYGGSFAMTVPAARGPLSDSPKCWPHFEMKMVD